MDFSEQIAKHLYEVYFGGNWTVTNFKETLSDVSWKEATTEVEEFNTIVTLVFHTNYFVKTVSRVLNNEGLSGNDKFSFDHPEFTSEEEWRAFVNDTLEDAKTLSESIKKLPNEKLMESFTDKKYGLYNRNLWGVIEHCHYHLGQIVMLKKLVQPN